MTCIDQTTCQYITETDRVGTRIRYTVKYSDLAKNDRYNYYVPYVPMYVQYPDDDDGIPINAEHFPDAKFRSYISNNIDSDKNSYLSNSEIASVTSITVDNLGISDLTGIKNFTNLNYLDCQKNSIKTLDLSGMTKLTSVWCWENNMEYLDVHNCTALPELWAFNNNLSTLYVYGCSKLKVIQVYNNSFTNLTISELPLLETLNLGGCDKLKKLYVCDNSNLKTLDVSGLKALTELDCTNNALTSLNVKNCTALVNVDCTGNRNISSLTLNGCSSLEKLERDSNIYVAGTTPVFSTSTLPNATVNKYYTANVRATATTAVGTTPVFYRLTARTSSLALNVDKNTGQIYGTPTAVTDDATITIAAYNYVDYVGSVSKKFNIKVLAEASSPTITTSNSESFNAITGISFKQTLTATGTTPITWTISSGKLPTGLTLNQSTGVISGTPAYTEDGNKDTYYSGIYYKFILRASNSAGKYSEKEFTIRLWTSPTITTSSTLQNGYVGQAYSAELYATGSKFGMGWALKSGSLPEGLSFGPMAASSSGRRTVTISGTPTRTGTYKFTMQVAAGSEYLAGLTVPEGKKATKEFTIVVQNAPSSVTAPTITTSNSDPIRATTGVNFQQTLVATGTSPITWTISSGKLPTGLTLNQSTGVISGKPAYTEVGKDSHDGIRYTFKVRASNSAGYSEKEFIIILWESPAITTANILTNGYVGTSYRSEIYATGSKMYMGWKLHSGSLPNGLSFGSMGGTGTGQRTLTISGTPTRAGTYKFTMQVAAGAEYAVGLSAPAGKSVLKEFTVQIADTPIIDGSFIDGNVGVYYSRTVEAKGGFAPYSWTYSGTLPTGLNVSRSGSKFTLAGTPSKEGNYSFTLKVTDNNGKAYTKTFGIKITTAGLAINSTNFPDSAFRSYISSNVDSNKDGFLSDSEIKSITSLSLGKTSSTNESAKISNLKGIEFFTALTYLDCQYNKLTAIDLSKNTALKTLICNNNQLKTLDLSKNVSLNSVDCNTNQLTTLALGNNSSLQNVNCANNPSLKTLNIKGCTNLSEGKIVSKGNEALEIVTVNGIVTPNIPVVEIKPAFKEYSLYLDGQIGVNFYLHLPEGVDWSNGNLYYMEFDVNQGTSNSKYQTYNPDFRKTIGGVVCYGFRCYINSAQLAEKITATFHYNGKTISVKKSVHDYLKQVMEAYKKQVATYNLMKAIMDYGHYAQEMLAETNGWQVGVKYVAMPCATTYTDADIAEVQTASSAYAFKKTSNNAAIKSLQATLLLDSDTIFNVYFKSNNFNGTVLAKVDNQQLYPPTIQSSGRYKGYYLVDILSIPAHKLGEEHTIRIEANGVTELKVSALTWANLVLKNSSFSEKTKKAATALYKYYEAAVAYNKSKK